MKAALRGASAANAAYALIIGDREASDGVAQLKPLREDGEQQAVAFGELAAAIRG
jgi:histidyl-tRNA synthetase